MRLKRALFVRSSTAFRRAFLFVTLAMVLASGGVLFAIVPDLHRASLTAPTVPDSKTAERIRRVESGLLPFSNETGPFLLADRMAFYKIPGVSVAVINNGAIEWARAYGVREIDGGPVTTETMFQAGSISKPVAAMAALHLVQIGKLNLDEDVNLKLKSWKVPENEFTRDQKVTLRGLLSHTAGTTVHWFPGYDSERPAPTLIQVLDGTKPPANTAPIRVEGVPGTKWSYSGGGYMVMQQLLIDVIGKPFPKILNELVLSKIGMRHSTYEEPLPAAMAPGSATGHVDGKKVHGRWHVYPEMAAAGLWTTPSDLALLAIEMERTLAGKSSRVLSSDMARQMLTVQKFSWGLGFSIEGKGDSARFQHGGDDWGFEAYFVAYNTRGQGAVVMTNGSRGTQLAAEIIRSIAKEYGWPDYLPPEK